VNLTEVKGWSRICLAANLAARSSKAPRRVFQRADCAQRDVCDSCAQAFSATHNNLDGVVEAWAQEQIKTGEVTDANIVAKTVFQLFNQPAKPVPIILTICSP
jgi:hypothetical protein